MAFGQRLYLRIWLAVVGGIAVLTLTVGWAWRMAEEQKAQNVQPFVPPSREMVLRDPNGTQVLRGFATRQPSDAGPFNCNRLKSCREMSGCAEARYQLQHCANPRIDGDRDGVPCEALCR